MDRENKIKTIIEVDIANAEKNIENLNKQKEKSTKANKNAAKSQSAYTKAIEAADDASGGLVKRLKALALNPFIIVLTALIAGFKLLQTAVNRSGKASKVFGEIGAKLSSIFNGVIAVLEPLVEFIGEKLLEAMNDPQKAIEDLGDAIKENLINRFEGLKLIGDSIIKLFQGDFTGALESLKDGALQAGTGIVDLEEKVKIFAEQAEKDFDKAAVATVDLANAEERLVRNRIALEKRQLTSLRLAEEERQIRDDVSKDIDERIAANQRLGVILEEQLQAELALAQQALGLARAQQAATGDTIENIQGVGDAEIKLLEIRERISGQRSEQLVNETSLQKESLDRQLAAQLEIDELTLQALRDKGESILAIELETLEKRRAQELEQLGLTELEKDAINLRFDEQRKAKIAEDEEATKEKVLEDFTAALEQQIEFDEIELERKIQNGEATNEVEKEILRNRSQIEIAAAEGDADKILAIEQKLKLAEDKIDNAKMKADAAVKKELVNNAIGAAGEAFGISQELAVAEMIIAAPKAVANSFTQASANFSPPISLAMGALGAAGVIIPIAKGLADIKKTRFSKSKGGSSAGGNISSSTGAGGGAAAGVASAASVSQSITPEVIEDLSANAGANLGTDTGLTNSASNTAANNVSATSQGQVVFSESRFQDFRGQVEFREERTTLG